LELCESGIQHCDITKTLPKFHFIHKTGNTAHPKKKLKIPSSRNIQRNEEVKK